MSINKPNLTRVWASEAPSQNVVDPDVTQTDKYKNGWLAEVPTFQNFNFLQQVFTQGLAHNNEQGINVWDTATLYPIDAISKGSNGLIYVSLTEQNGNDPTVDNGSNWKPRSNQELSALSSFTFDTVANLQLGKTIGNRDIIFELNQALMISGENGTIRFFVVSAVGDIDLGGGLFAKELSPFDISNSTAAVAPCENIVFDMQRVSLKSQGAISGEPLTTVEWTSTSNELKGSGSLQIGTNTAVAGQLIGYLADDGEYYTARVKTAGTTISLYDPLEADVSIGSTVFSFYKDKSHPSINGYRAIADYMLRQRVYHSLSDNVNSVIYNKFSGPETISTLATDTFDNCGSSEYPAVRLQTSAQDDGFFTGKIVAVSGDTNVELTINTNGSNIRVRIAENDDLAQFIYDEIINSELPTKIIIPIRKKVDSELIIRMQQFDIGSADVNFIMKFLSGSIVKIDTLNGGTHVLHGDSWFAQEGIFERLQERLPRANIINNGVGGRTSTNLATTMYDEVEPLKPDYVWCLAGVNDAILGVSVSGFHRWMNQTIANVKDIGATPILFTPAPGNLIDVWLARSKAYLYTYDYRDGNETQFEEHLISFAGVTIPPTSDVFCGTAGRTRNSVIVTEAFGNGVNNMNFGYSTGMSQPTLDVDVKAGNTIIGTTTIVKSDDSERYFNISCENTTGSSQTANGFARVRIHNSRK